MLKIKDNIDLKELGKFGFWKSKDFNGGEFYCNNFCNLIIHSNRRIGCWIQSMQNFCGQIEEFNVLFDLIQAGVVEKV